MSTSKVGRTIHPRNVVTPGHGETKKNSQMLETVGTEIERLKKANEMLSTELIAVKSKVEESDKRYANLVKTTLDMTEMVKKLIKKDTTLTDTVEKLSTTVTTFIQGSEPKTSLTPDLKTAVALEGPAIQGTLPEVEVKEETTKKRWKFF